MNIDNWFVFACAAAAINGCIFGIAARFSLFPGKQDRPGQVARRANRPGRQTFSAWCGMAMVFGILAILFMMPAWQHNQLDLWRMMASCFALSLVVSAQPELLGRIADTVARGLARID
jgi:hypothetical protein